MVVVETVLAGGRIDEETRRKSKCACGPCQSGIFRGPLESRKPTCGICTSCSLSITTTLLLDLLSPSLTSGRSQFFQHRRLCLYRHQIKLAFFPDTHFLTTPIAFERFSQTHTAGSVAHPLFHRHSLSFGHLRFGPRIHPFIDRLSLYSCCDRTSITPPHSFASDGTSSDHHRDLSHTFVPDPRHEFAMSANIFRESYVDDDAPSSRQRNSVIDTSTISQLHGPRRSPPASPPSPAEPKPCSLSPSACLHTPFKPSLLNTYNNLSTIANPSSRYIWA